MTGNVIFISAKCSDMCAIYGSLGNRGFSYDGYPLPARGLMSGDYIDFGIDLETGKIVDWDSFKESLTKAILHSDEVAWEDLN